MGGSDVTTDISAISLRDRLSWGFDNWYSCDSGSPIVLFLVALIGGSLMLTALIYAAIRKGAASNDSIVRVKRPLFGVWASSLVVVLSCAVGGHFPRVMQHCLAGLAVSCSLVPLVGASIILLLLHRGTLALDAVILHEKSAAACFALFFSVW